jgi:hypothetical protein
MRSLFAVLSTIWFLGAAWLIGDGSVAAHGDPPDADVAGDPSVMAVYFLARVAFVGFAMLALAFVDWARLFRSSADIGVMRRDPERPSDH